PDGSFGGWELSHEVRGVPEDVARKYLADMLSIQHRPDAMPERDAADRARAAGLSNDEANAYATYVADARNAGRIPVSPATWLVERRRARRGALQKEVENLADEINNLDPDDPVDM